MRRFFGAKGSSDESATKPIKANMGKKLDMYYNTELNRWVVRGSESQAAAEMAEKSVPPPAPISQLGPPSPLPSNAKQGVPFWVKPSAPVAVDHRRIQSFQPYHPRALHQLHQAQPDEPPGNETGNMGPEMGFSTNLPPRGRLAPSPPLGAARSSSAMPMNPHMSPPAARPRPSDASIPDVNATVPQETSGGPPLPPEPPMAPSHQMPPPSQTKPSDHSMSHLHEPLPPAQPPLMLPPQLPGSGEYARRDSMHQENVSTIIPPRTDASDGLSTSQHRASIDFTMLSSASVPQVNESLPPTNAEIGSIAPPPSLPDVGRSTLPPMPGDGSTRFAGTRQSRAPSNSQRSTIMEGGPVVVMRRASRSRLQHRSPPISRRGTLKSDACELDSPGRAQPVVTFDRVAFRSKYSNTIQTLDEIFCSLLEIYAVEARKIGKTASQSLLQHFDRLRVLLPGSRSANQAEKMKNILSSVDTDTETKSSDRPTSAGETLLTKQADYMIRDLEEGLKKQQNALEDLQHLQSRILEVAQVDGEENASQEQQLYAEKWRQTLDIASRELAEIRNEIEEITCLSSSLLGQRRMAEESFQLNILQIGREVEDHFTQVLKPKVQEIIRNKIVTIHDEKEQAIEQMRQAMEAQKAEFEKQIEEIKNQYEVDKIEFLNEFERKKDELSQLADLREELEVERAQLEQERARHQEDVALSKEELTRLETYITEQQNALATKMRMCEEEENRISQMRQATEARDAELAVEREAIAKEKVELAGERKFLEHEKRRIILVSKGLESRRSKLEAKQKQKKQISDTVSTGGGSRVVLGSDGSVSGDGIMETC